MKKALSLLCLLALLFTATTAFAATNIPSPSEDFYVLDEANVLEYETEGLIVFTNDLLKEACGAEIVVVTVESTNGTAIDDYVYELINSWGVGDSKKQNGLVLLLAIKDDNYYALQGDGLYDTLQDGEIKDLLNKYLEPDFARKDYDAGVNKVFAQLVSAVSAIYNAGVSTKDGQKLLDEYLAEQDGYESQTSSASNSARTSGGDRGAVDRGGSGSEGGSALMGLIIFIAIIVIILVVVSRSKRRQRAYRTYSSPTPVSRPTQTFGGTTYTSDSDSFGRGFLGGYLLGRRRATPPPPPPSGAFGGNSYGGARPVSRPSSGGFTSSRSSGSSSSHSSSGGFSSSRSSSGAGRSFGSSHSSSGGSRSFGGSRSGGFGGGRSGGGGGSRGGGAGRGR